MKKLILILPLVLLCACAEKSNNSSETQGQKDGVVNGGGGKGVLCKNSNAIEVLDLYEAKFVYGLELENSRGSYDADLRFALERVTKHLHWSSTGPGDIEEAIAYAKKLFQDTVTFIPAGSRLKVTKDSYEPIVAEGCDVVQVAFYYNEEKILIDKDYWDRLSSLNQVALFIHEILYKMDRDYGATDSRESRKFVGRLFSTTPLKPISDSIPEDRNKLWKCWGGIPGETPQFSLVLYRDKEINKHSGIVLQFFQIGNHRVLGLTRALPFGNPLLNGTGNTPVISDDSRINGWWLNFETGSSNDGAIKMRLLKKDQTPDSPQFTNVYCREK